MQRRNIVWTGNIDVGPSVRISARIEKFTHQKRLISVDSHVKGCRTMTVVAIDFRIVRQQNQEYC